MYIFLNGAKQNVTDLVTVNELLAQLKLESRKVAVELNKKVIPLKDHGHTAINEGDYVEVVTLVGGGSGEELKMDTPLKIGKFEFKSRLITGTGKYSTLEQMKYCLDLSDCEVTTVAVRRERLVDKQGRSILDFLDLKKLVILPNTAGCYSAEDAVRHARLGRELLRNLENPGSPLGKTKQSSKALKFMDV
jgi:thiazole synthase